MRRGGGRLWMTLTSARTITDCVHLLRVGLLLINALQVSLDLNGCQIANALTDTGFVQIHRLLVTDQSVTTNATKQPLLHKLTARHMHPEDPRRQIQRSPFGQFQNHYPLFSLEGGIVVRKVECKPRVRTRKQVAGQGHRL
jgi:hypothetical protein